MRRMSCESQQNRKLWRALFFQKLGTLALATAQDCPKRSRPVQLPRTDGQDEVTWAAVALRPSPARASRVSDPEIATAAVAMDVTPSVLVADSSPALPLISLPVNVAAPVPDPPAVNRIGLPIVSDPAPAAVTLSVSEPVPEAAPSVVPETVSAVATVVVDREGRNDAPAEPKPRRERPTERADNVTRIRSASISGVSSRKARTPSPVVTCVPPYKSTSKQKKLQRASQRAAVDWRQASASDRCRQRPAAYSQPEASVSSAESRRDEKVRHLKVLLTQTDPVVASGTAMDVASSVSPAQLVGKRKSDDSHCRRIRPLSQDSGSDSAAGAGPATAASSGATVRMDTEVVQPPVFSSAKCYWAADVEVEDVTGAAAEEPPTSQPTVLPVTYAAALASPTALQRRPVTTNDATNEPDPTPTESTSDDPPPRPAIDAAPKMPAQPDADPGLGNTMEIDSLIVPTAAFLPERRDSLASPDTEGRTRKQRSPKRRKRRRRTVSGQEETLQVEEEVTVDQHEASEPATAVEDVMSAEASIGVPAHRADAELNHERSTGDTTPRTITTSSADKMDDTPVSASTAWHEEEVKEQDPLRYPAPSRPHH
ncbi:calphotin-like [Schistocerca piceifrons]|uniref:calphotin-like n=1 Tax=Schistocerca piceifrons TaxID=274613 RepID=UPI001F5F8613|nr:calphotin-like [Schistocerca piceifrons]